MQPYVYNSLTCNSANKILLPVEPGSLPVPRVVEEFSNDIENKQPDERLTGLEPSLFMQFYRLKH